MWSNHKVLDISVDEEFKCNGMFGYAPRRVMTKLGRVMVTAPKSFATEFDGKWVWFFFGYLQTKHVLYFLYPKITVVLDFRIASLTNFIENTCNIYISK